MKMMILAMIFLTVCHAVLEFATSSQDADRVTSVCSILNEHEVFNAVDFASHEEGISKSGKCENMEKG